MILPKKILFIDDDNLQTETRAQLLMDTRHHVVVVVDSFDEVKILYQEDKFDIVIIDFARDFGMKSLEYIDSIDPMQKMITISENEEYSESKGCDYCVKYHQRRRLKPPFPFPELVRLIENFEITSCKYRNSL
ncbi:response regulator [Sulfurimonas sp. HSL3-7]|uniref:response regulator n=1 Tax=Sulfonitrofixus jiaomeiensis TaxID=3131938 RepID=UPI0031F87F8D